VCPPITLWWAGETEIRAKTFTELQHNVKWLFLIPCEIMWQQLDDYMSCVLGAQPMLGAIITTRSLSVKAANPTLKKNKSGKNAYFHFLPLPALFSTSTSEVENLRRNRHHLFFFGSKPSLHCRGRNPKSIVGMGRLQLKTRDLSEVAFWRKLHT